MVVLHTSCFTPELFQAEGSGVPPLGEAPACLLPYWGFHCFINTGKLLARCSRACKTKLRVTLQCLGAVAGL